MSLKENEKRILVAIFFDNKNNKTGPQAESNRY